MTNSFLFPSLLVVFFYFYLFCHFYHEKRLCIFYDFIRGALRRFASFECSSFAVKGVGKDWKFKWGRTRRRAETRATEFLAIKRFLYTRGEKCDEIQHFPSSQCWLKSQHGQKKRGLGWARYGASIFLSLVQCEIMFQRIWISGNEASLAPVGTIQNTDRRYSFFFS